jgi:carboxypeptidase family protein/TonB-dependent receptor-like protein
MSLKAFSLLLALAVLALGATSVGAQTSRGTVTGTVTDPQNQVISGAEVELKNPSTNTSRTTTSNDSGIYRFDAVDLGTYEVVIRAKGFKTSNTSGVLAQANLITDVDVEMAVGTQEETVNVNAGLGEILQTSDVVRSGNFNAQQVASLPSTNLNPYDLGRLLPGVTTSTTNAQFGNSAQFSVNGQRPRGNNYLIDGTENNDISVTGPATVINNEDAIAEVSVQTGLYSAEFGRAGGGVFNLVTKSGTNEYHGTAKWLILSQVFNSLTSTEKAVNRITRDGANNTAKFAVFTENIFGGTIGGPLPLPHFGEGGRASIAGKDHNWFFFGIQWDRYRSTTLQSPRVPTVAGVQALRALFPAGTNPRVDLYLSVIGDVRGVPTQSPVNVALGTGPNGAGVTVARGNIETALANVGLGQFINDKQWVIRTDHNISDAHKLTFRFTNDYFIQNLSSFVVNPGFTTDVLGPSRNILITHTWIINSSITNEARVSPYGLIDFQFPFADNASALARTLPNISFASTNQFSTIGIATNLPQGRRAKNFLVQDTLTKVWNSHTFRFGFEVLRQTARQRPPFNERGSFAFASNSACAGPPNCPAPVAAFTGFANFVDNFSGAGGTANINFGVPFYTPNLLRKSYFVQDTWRATQSLTLTLGTRYEDFGQPANNAFKFPAFAGFDAAAFLVPNKVERDKNNFGPIFGFAYSPQWESGPIAWLFPRDRSVIRGGYQVSYDTWFNNLLSNIAADSPNNTATTTTGSGIGRGTANFFPNAIPSTPVSPSATNSQTSVFNPQIRNPYTQRWSLGVQRELPFGLIMDASYVGSVGRKLFVTEDLNPIVNPSTGARRFPTLGIRRYRTSGANSDYHSAQLRVDKRLSRGLQVGTSYTWAKNTDQISEVFATGQTNSSLASIPAFLGGLLVDHAVSDYHRKHRFVANFVWDLPVLRGNNWAGKLLGGWRLNGIITLQSGAPFTIVNGLDRNGDGVSTADRPDIGNPNAPHNTRALVVAAGTCASLLRNPDTLQCVTRNDVYVVQVATATGTTLTPLSPATLGRNTERSNPVKNVDASLFKTFRLGENLKLEYRVEAFNVFNHPQQTGLPGLDLQNTTAGRFLNYDFVSGGRRTARMGLKIIF